MKIKKISANVMCASLILSNLIVVNASNVIINESPIDDEGIVTASDTGSDISAETGWTTDERNLSDVEVTYQQSSNYSVTIPKTITLASNKRAGYSVKVSGDIDTTQRVYVAPVDLISDTEEVDFYMKDQNGKKDDVVATVTQNKIYWNSEEVTSGYEETDNSISAPDLTSGTWKGTFQVEIKLQSSGNENTGNEDDKQQVAGLYDADGVLLASWEESGIDDTCSNASDVIGRTYPNTSKVIISDSVTSLGTHAFYYCNALTELELSNSVTSIDNQAIENCNSLTSIYIPDSVSNIGQHNFYKCENLTSIEVSDSNANYSSQNGVLFNKDKTKLISYPCGKTNTDYTIPDSVSEIDYYAFSYSKLKNIIIPNSVTRIGTEAFRYSSLTSVEIPESVTSLGMWSFAECASLTYVKIPGSLKGYSVGQNSFQKCTSLKTAVVNSDNIAYMMFEGCTSLTNVTISNAVKKIGQEAFSGCTSLTNLSIPTSVTAIDSNAFKDVPHVSYSGSATGSPWGAKSIN